MSTSEPKSGDRCDRCFETHYKKFIKVVGGVEKVRSVTEPLKLTTYYNEDGTDDHICSYCIEPYEQEQMGVTKWKEALAESADIADGIALIQQLLEPPGTQSPSATLSPAPGVWSATTSSAITAMRSLARRVGR